MERDQFTLYRSYYEAISRIRKKTDRADAYDALCAYALFCREPELDQLPDSAAIAFTLIKPNLDASRRKAESGKRGGLAKQTGSKGEANRIQTGSEKESEKEKEREDECLPPVVPLPEGAPSPKREAGKPEAEDWGFGPELTEAFHAWLRYKREKRQDYKPEGLRALVTETRHNAERYGEAAVAALIRKCMASNWQGIIWDRLPRMAPDAGGGNVFLTMLREENREPD